MSKMKELNSLVTEIEGVLNHTKRLVDEVKKLLSTEDEVSVRSGTTELHISQAIP